MIANLRHGMFAAVAAVFAGVLCIAAAAGPALTTPLA